MGHLEFDGSVWFFKDWGIIVEFDNFGMGFDWQY